MFIIGFVCYKIGSEDIAREFEEQTELDQREVYCMKCDQYLGLAKKFDTLCPRCKSNRIVYKDSKESEIKKMFQNKLREKND